MDRFIGRNRMIFMLFLSSLSLCHCWLSDYFNVSDASFNSHRKVAIQILELCSFKKVDWWEKNIRERTVNCTTCSFSKELRNCSFNAYQDPAAEYIKHLEADSIALCKKNNCEYTMLEYLSFFIASSIFICIFAVLIFVRAIIERSLDTIIDNCKEGSNSLA